MLSKKVRIIINIITIVALVVLIYISWPQIIDGLEKIGGAKWSIIFLMIPLQILNFYSVAKIYQSYFANTNGHNRISTKTLFKTALELNFVNNVFPSGGVAGFSYLGLRLRSFGIPVARTTLAQTMRFGLLFISFLFILFFGMFFLSFGSGTSGGGIALFIGLSIAFLTLFLMLIFIYLVGSEKRIKTFTAFLPKLANTILRGFAKRNIIPVKRIEKLFVDFHRDYMFLAKDWKQLKKPFCWAFLANITEIATIYLAYVALGQFVNPGAVILAYAVASFAGLISIFPGGVGVYETLMTVVLASAGVPKALALSATLIYRIFTWIAFIPAGFILYQIALKKGYAEHPKHAAIKRDSSFSN
jgi:uncharacterized protein (TIRG00374 family)